MFIRSLILSLVISTLILVGGWYFFVLRPAQIKEQKELAEVHYHAGFQVYVDGRLQDFSDFKYMSLAPCTEGDDHPRDIQKEKAHLHEGNGDVVHVHVPQGTWGDLFKNIRFELDMRKPLIAYRNGQKVENILQQEIQPDESVIIFSGALPANEAEALANAVTPERIVQVERLSEACGSAHK